MSEHERRRSLAGLTGASAAGTAVAFAAVVAQSGGWRNLLLVLIGLPLFTAVLRLLEVGVIRFNKRLAGRLETQLQAETGRPVHVEVEEDGHIEIRGGKDETKDQSTDRRPPTPQDDE